MSEEIKKEVEDPELNQTAGGVFSRTYTCPYCGKTFENADTLVVEMNIKWHMAQHMVPNEDKTE
jgi:hypothetical protein